MNIFKNPTSLLYAACSSAILLAACQPHETKGDAAFERVKAEKLLTEDSSLVNEAMTAEPIKKEAARTIEAPDQWTLFRNATEKKILANEQAIKALKKIPDTNAKWRKQVASLEESNHALRKQLDVYHEEAKLKWENFKATMDHDVNDIGITLKNLANTI